MSTAKMALIAVAGVAAGLLFTVLAVPAGDERAVSVTLALSVGGIAARHPLSQVFSAGPRSSGKRGASASPSRRRDPFRVLDADFHPFLRFGKLPGTQRVENVVWGSARRSRGAGVRLPAARRGRDPLLLRHGLDPDGWPSLLVRRHGPLDVARNAAGLQRIEFELDEFNRAL